ncbi:hypothetical protein HK104_001228 [Borealophlyctis nickersoniae]|nr:hypothetical protein HK104_001228 [Borealophlyctis nickersoniae]
MQSSCASPVITANDILMAIRALRFQGLSGNVQFSGTDQTSVSYSYIQFKGTAWNQIGSWSTSGTNTTNSTGTVNINDAALVWRPGYSSAPLSVLEPEMVTSKMPLAIIIKALSAIGMAVHIFVAVYFYRNREHAVIKRASPTFCIMMWFGMLLIFADLFWFGFVMGPMLVKTFQIYKIFDSNRLRAHKLQDSQLLGMSSIVVAGELILLIVWSAGDPVRAILVDSSSSELYTSQKCFGAHLKQTKTTSTIGQYSFGCRWSRRFLGWSRRLAGWDGFGTTGGRSKQHQPPSLPNTDFHRTHS